MKIIKRHYFNHCGFILLESIISIFLITLLLIPIFNFASLFIKLKNQNIQRVELPINTNIKNSLTLGYDNLLSSDLEFKKGYFSNIGMKNTSYEQEFFYIPVSYDLFNREVFYISTQLSKYSDCL